MTKILKKYIDVLCEEYFLYGGLANLARRYKSHTRHVDDYDREDNDIQTSAYLNRRAQKMADEWIEEKEDLGLKISDKTKKEIKEFSKRFLAKAMTLSDNLNKSERILKTRLEKVYGDKIKEPSGLEEVAGNYSMTGLRRMQATGNIRSGFEIKGSRDSNEGDVEQETSFSSQERASLPQASIVFLMKDGKILAVSRGDDLSNMNMPGGGVEPGEDPKHAAIRELWEETGIRADDAIHIFSKVMNGKLIHFYRVTSYGGSLRSSDEGVASWEKPSALLRSQYGDSLRQVIAALKGDVISPK